MGAADFADLEALEVATLEEHLALIKGEAALRALLLKIISLPRQNVFGAVVIQSGALRRAITGEVLTEAQHTPMPSATRLFRVAYTLRGNRIESDIIAHTADDAIARMKRMLADEGILGAALFTACPIVNERGFAHLNQKG